MNKKHVHIVAINSQETILYLPLNWVPKAKYRNNFLQIKIKKFKKIKSIKTHINNENILIERMNV